MTFAEQLKRAMWEGDVDKLHEIAPCACCCHEHTFPDCDARLWGGCKSGLPYGYGPDQEAEYIRSWQQHYERYHGMSESEFYGRDDDN